MKKTRNRAQCQVCSIKTEKVKLSIVTLPYTYKNVRLCNDCMKGNPMANIHKVSSYEAWDNFQGMKGGFKGYMPTREDD